MAETERRASAELRKKAAPRKQEIVRKSNDLSSLRNAFEGTGEGTLSTTLDQYNRYVLVETDASGQQYVRYLFVDPNGRDWERLSGTEVIQRVKSTYKNQDALRKVLYQKGFLTEREYVSKSTSALNGAILQAATEFSTEVADSYTTEGKIKFPTFQNWMSARGEMGGSENLPTRDINLIDRDVLESFVRSVYLETAQEAPSPEKLKEKTDMLMERVEKGSLTTVEKQGGQMVRKTTPGFSQERAKAELVKQIKKEQPEAIKRVADLNFLGFLDDLGGMG